MFLFINDKRPWNIEKILMRLRLIKTIRVVNAIIYLLVKIVQGVSIETLFVRLIYFINAFLRRNRWRNDGEQLEIESDNLRLILHTDSHVEACYLRVEIKFLVKQFESNKIKVHLCASEKNWQ